MNDLEPITSRNNRRLVELRKVRDGRDKTRIFIEGKRLVEEAVRSPIAIEECFFHEGRVDANLLTVLSERNVTMHAVASKIFPSLADTETSQGIILTARRPKHGVRDIIAVADSKAHVVFLSEVNNPSNIGAVIRTAEAAGVSGVILSKKSADPYSPKSLRASMGSAFRMKIIESAELTDTIDQARDAGISSVAMDISGTKKHNELDWSGRRLIVLGSEAHGLAETDLSMIDEKVVISMENQVESLNLAVSAGIVFFEARRQANLRV